MPAPNNPKGAKSDKEWCDAIRLAVHEVRQAEDATGKKHKMKALRMLAAKLVNRALEGDVAALREIGDRLDGRPTQAVESTMRHNYVARIPDPIDSAEEWSKKYAPPTQGASLYGPQGTGLS